MDTASYAATYIENDFPLEVTTWLLYLFIPVIGSLLSSCYLLFFGLLLIPIYSWKLLFHLDGCSILDILQNPEGKDWFVWCDDNNNWYQWRERAHFVPQWALRTCWRCMYICWSNTPLNALPIWGYNSRLCMFSFYQIHPTSINKTNGRPSSEDGVTNKVSETTQSLSAYHRSHLSLGAKILCKLRPTVPPRGIISSFLVLLFTLSILSPIGYRMSLIMSGTKSTNYASLQGSHLWHFRGSYAWHFQGNNAINKGDNSHLWCFQGSMWSITLLTT